MQDKIVDLRKFMPADAVPVIEKWILDSGCQFKVSKSRSSKFGDYRAPHRGLGHRISVNKDLNPYAFLITTVHEFAHLKTWTEHKHTVKPHGTAWKSNFRHMMQLLGDEIFPEDIRDAVSHYLHNPQASSCTDLHLFRVLKRYDIVKENCNVVEALPHKSIFALPNGRTFEKGMKLRKRYRCVEVKTGRIYLFNPLAEVHPVAVSHQ